MSTELDISKRISDYLKTNRVRITADSPITGSKLCAIARKAGIEIDGGKLREYIFELRSESVPIGSRMAHDDSEAGYWYVIRAEDWDLCIPHLISRVKKQNETIRNCQKMQERMKTIEDGLFSIPMFKLLEETFGLERIK